MSSKYEIGEKVDIVVYRERVGKYYITEKMFMDDGSYLYKINDNSFSWLKESQIVKWSFEFEIGEKVMIKPDYEENKNIIKKFGVDRILTIEKRKRSSLRGDNLYRIKNDPSSLSWYRGERFYLYDYLCSKDYLLEIGDFLI